MNKEQKFYKALQDVFIRAKFEIEGSFVNLMRIKSNNNRKIKEMLKTDIENITQKYPVFLHKILPNLAMNTRLKNINISIKNLQI